MTQMPVMVDSRRRYLSLTMLHNNEMRRHPVPKTSLFDINDEMIVFIPTSKVRRKKFEGLKRKLVRRLRLSG
jgi:hypothetical protein